MEILYPIGTSYLCSQFINHDGTYCSDHPVYLFQTSIDNIALAVMFTTKVNPYTVHNKKGKSITFTACSTFRNERESEKVLQAEIYICEIDKLSLSEYTFKYPVKHSQSFFGCLELSLKEHLINPDFGIKSVHWYNNKNNVSDQEEIITKLLNFVKKINRTPGFTFPPEGITNCDYFQYKKEINSNKNITHNKKIFQERWGNK